MGALTDVRNGLLRYATQAFINENSVEVILNRKIFVEKPGGGRDKASITLQPQIFRLINQTSSGGSATSSNDGGQVHRYEYVMVGLYDADIEVDDTWTEGEAKYHVNGILPNNGWETRVSVTAFSSEPIHG